MNYPEKPTSSNEQIPHIIEYPELVDVVQLSVARLLDIEGSIEANSFKEVQATLPRYQEHLLDQIGDHFDEALINFVGAALVGRRQPIIILAEASEGFDGWLPWEEKLAARANILAKAGLSRHATLRIERYEVPENITQLLPSTAMMSDDTPQAA